MSFTRKNFVNNDSNLPPDLLNYFDGMKLDSSCKYLIAQMMESLNPTIYKSLRVDEIGFSNFYFLSNKMNLFSQDRVI